MNLEHFSLTTKAVDFIGGNDFGKFSKSNSFKINAIIAGKRVVTALITPLTATIDALAHTLFFFIKLIAGCIPYTFLAKKLNYTISKKTIDEFSLKSSVVHLCNAWGNLLFVPFSLIFSLHNPNEIKDYCKSYRPLFII